MGLKALSVYHSIPKLSTRFCFGFFQKRAFVETENLPGLRLVEMDNRLMSDAACLAAELGLGGTDSVYVALANQPDLPLVTFDADHRERAEKRITIQNIE